MARVKPRYIVGDKTAFGDPKFDAAAGNISDISTVNKFGQNSSIATSATETIWDGSNAYTFPTGADITRIVGTAGDTESVEVQGLDTNWLLSTETYTLNGATPVTLSPALRRVFRMKVVDSTAPGGNVDVTDTAGTTVYGRITSGNNQTLMAVYTVPANKTAYMTNYYATLNRAAGGGSTVGVTIKLWVVDNENTYVKQIKHVAGIDSTADSTINHSFDPYFRITQKSDIYIDGTNQSASITGDVSAGFDLYLVDD